MLPHRRRRLPRLLKPPPKRLPRQQQAPIRASSQHRAECVVHAAGAVVRRYEGRVREGQPRHHGQLRAHVERRSTGPPAQREGQPAVRHLVGRPAGWLCGSHRRRPARSVRLAQHGQSARPEAVQGRRANSWAGVYVGTLGFATNKNWLADNPGVEPPTSWADLLKPEFKGQIMVAHPSSSGTSYTALCTVLQMMGEEKGWEFIKEYAGQVDAVHQERRGAGQVRRPGRSRRRHRLLARHRGRDREGLAAGADLPGGRHRL